MARRGLPAHPRGNTAECSAAFPEPRVCHLVEKGDPTNERPVTITWRFGGGDEADGINATWGPKWETSEFPAGCAVAYTSIMDFAMKPSTLRPERSRNLLIES